MDDPDVERVRGAGGIGARARFYLGSHSCREGLAALGSGATRLHGAPAILRGVVLFALEILVAADLIRTVAVAPTLANVAVLGLIVLIRTFLSFSLEIEIEGVPPWRRLATSGAAIAARAAAQAAVDSPARQPPAASDEPVRKEPD